MFFLSVRPSSTLAYKNTMQRFKLAYGNACRRLPIASARKQKQSSSNILRRQCSFPDSPMPNYSMVEFLNNTYVVREIFEKCGSYRHMRLCTFPSCISAMRHRVLGWTIQEWIDPVHGCVQREVIYGVQAFIIQERGSYSDRMKDISSPGGPLTNRLQSAQLFLELSEPLFVVGGTCDFDRHSWSLQNS